MARIAVVGSDVAVRLTMFDRFFSLYYGEMPVAPLAAITDVSLVEHPTRELIDATVRPPWLSAEYAGMRPRSVFPRASTYDDGRACVATWRWTPAVQVEFDPNCSPWVLFLVSDPDAESIVRRLEELPRRDR